MSAQTDTLPIYGRTYWVTVVVGIGFLAADLILLSRASANAWWYDVTLFIAFIIADLLTMILDRIFKLSKSQVWTPVKFIAFAIAIEAGALISVYFSSQIANLFNGLYSTSTTFFALNYHPANLALCGFLSKIQVSSCQAVLLMIEIA